MNIRRSESTGALMKRTIFDLFLFVFRFAFRMGNDTDAKEEAPQHTIAQRKIAKIVHQK